MMFKALSQMAIRHGLLPSGYDLLRLYMLSVRRQVIGEERLLGHLQKGGKAIIAIWHSRVFPAVGYAERLSPFAPSVMISRSRDGEIASQLARRLKIRPVRGSSSEGGRQALATLIEDLKENQLAGHVLDGPRGPRGIMKAGLISLAQRSGVPVFPVYVSFSNPWILRSWDRFLIPKPFSRILIRWDEPFVVPPVLSEQEFEEWRLKVERHMRGNQEADDRRFGWNNLFA
ncbi:MAG: hypothetical protein A4E73_02541 [Syntrophaceae bacterium PtaU1.Bin231]|nr:MAG: hypothetical protein A4E73_02541 [Syntrophaceae bacterium PtaU1.Bin231]